MEADRLAQSKVLAIIGSPHTQGNTAKLVRDILKGAKSSGVETDLICLGDLQINPCRACETCKSTGECIQKDDMEKIFNSIETADALVLGTPIYFDHVSAQTKAFIDRLYYYGSPEDIRKKQFPRNVKGIIVITYEWNRREAYEEVIKWIRHTLEHYFKVEVIGTLRGENTAEKPVDERKDLLDEACRMRRELSMCLRSKGS